MNDGLRRYSVLVGVSLFIIILDQMTKSFIMHSMNLHQSVIIIPEFFSLTYIRNPGAAFGIFANATSAFRMIFFIGTSLFALGLLGTIFYRLPRNDWWGHLTISSIFGGAIGNLIDRVQYGEVIDFLDFYINGYHWPAFNVADSAISMGVISLLILFGLDKKKSLSAVETVSQESQP